MNSFIEALNHPADAFKKHKKLVSWGLVIITVLINSVFEPILQHFWAIGKPDINMLHILKITGLGIASYLLICTAFWLVCKCFGSRSTLMDHINAWGISYTPTAICAVVVALTEVFFYVFWNGTLWGMLLSIVFVGILIWKAILYFIYLREYAGIKGLHFMGACVVMGIIIIAITALDGYWGVKTPVL